MTQARTRRTAAADGGSIGARCARPPLGDVVSGGSARCGGGGGSRTCDTPVELRRRGADASVGSVRAWPPRRPRGGRRRAAMRVTRTLPISRLRLAVAVLVTLYRARPVHAGAVAGRLRSAGSGSLPLKYP